jgi:hypothetical protein
MVVRWLVDALKHTKKNVIQAYMSASLRIGTITINRGKWPIAKYFNPVIH